jgi:hypothetical protein
VTGGAAPRIPRPAVNTADSLVKTMATQGRWPRSACSTADPAGRALRGELRASVTSTALSNSSGAGCSAPAHGVAGDRQRCRLVCQALGRRVGIGTDPDAAHVGGADRGAPAGVRAGRRAAAAGVRRRGPSPSPAGSPRSDRVVPAAPASHGAWARCPERSSPGCRIDCGLGNRDTRVAGIGEGLASLPLDRLEQPGGAQTQHGPAKSTPRTAHPLSDGGQQP